MRQLLIQRAVYNKTTNELLVNYLKEIPKEELFKLRTITIHTTIKEEYTLFDIFAHLVLCQVLLYQCMNKKGILSKYNQNLLDYKLPDPLRMPRTDQGFQDTIYLLERIDSAILELFENIDFNSYDIDDFSRKENFMENTPATFIEQLFTHSAHHRGQMSQILSELKVGEDFSRFYKFGVMG